jgi:hypothetical protein
VTQNRGRAAMLTTKQPAERKLLQVAADGHFGDAKLFGKLPRAEHMHPIGFLDKLDDVILALFFVHFVQIVRMNIIAFVFSVHFLDRTAQRCLNEHYRCLK